MKKVVVLIPALNPPASFPQYVSQLLAQGFADILVVNDGSSSDECFRQIQDMGCIVLNHSQNEGKGQALKTGFTYYQENYDFEEYAGVITADSDGQHLVKDVCRMAEELVSGNGELLLGARDFSLAQIPPKSRFGNNLTSWIFRYLLRFRVTDTQTGLRGIPNILIEPCLKLPGKRFEYETTMLTEVGRKFGICEIPIETVYYEENRGTHFNPIVDSFMIYKIIFGTFLKYVFSSLSSCVIDLLLFTLFSKGLLAGYPYYIFVSTILARIVSATYNFCMNRNVVFKSQEGYGKTAVCYMLLCISQMVLSGLLVTVGCRLLRADEVITKMFVDTILFFVSYLIQKKLIFCGGKNTNECQK